VYEHQAQPRTRISTAVMTHPDRRGRAELLRQRCEEITPVVVVDPEPGARPSAWRTARAAWDAVAPDATHHLVLQDDAELSDGFVAAVHEAIRSRPDDALCLFVEWGSRSAGSVRIAAATGATWAPVVDDYIPSVALVLPARHAADFAAYAADTSDETVPDDVVLLSFLRGRGIRVLALVEGLVEHDRAGSLVGNSIMGLRRSVNPQPAWSGRMDATVTDDLPAVPYYDWWDQQAAMFIPDDESSDGWTRLRSGPAFEYLGADVAVAEATYEAEAHSASERLRDLVSAVIRREIWKTAFLLGVVVRRVGAREDLSEAFVAATRTMAPGGLRRIVPVHLIPEVTELLHPLVLAAVAAGRDHAQASESTSPTSTWRV
jgi:hypothetical protein